MSIEIIDTLSQKNNGTFPLVDSNDVKGGYYQVNSIQERNEIPLPRRKEGMLCYVKDDKIYQLLNGTTNEDWSVFYSNGRNIHVGEETPVNEGVFVWIDTSDDEVLF